MTTTTPYAPVRAAAWVHASGQPVLGDHRDHSDPRGQRVRTASTALIAPGSGRHATGLPFAGMPLSFRDDATGLPPRGAPV